jgi:transcriptional regulator with XRE-family HTH domain
MEMTEAQATWGAQIRRVRREKELTAAAVAREVGISRGYLHEIERGRYAPSDEVKVRIAKAIGVDPNELFHLKAAS